MVPSSNGPDRSSVRRGSTRATSVSQSCTTVSCLTHGVMLNRRAERPTRPVVDCESQ